jgi:flagellar operon protein
VAEPFRIQGGSPAGQPVAPRSAPAGQKATGPSFADTLSQAQQLRFSNHAQKRLQDRDIALTDSSVNRLAQAVERAEAKGGKSSLVLVDDLAFIVNVRERMVVTAMDAKSQREGVFTQIDTVVFAEPAEGSGE